MKTERTMAVCPVTGLPVVTRPEWTEVRFGDDFRATFKLIGEAIFLIQPRGYARLNDIRGFVGFSKQLVDEVFLEGRPVVAVEDLQDLQGISPEARRYYIKNYKDRTRGLAVIFCNASVVQRIAVLLAKRLRMVQTTIHLAGDYASALILAQEILAEKASPKPDRPALKLIGGEPAPPDEGAWERVSRPAWSLGLKEFESRFEVIGGTILHSVSSGSISKNQVAEIGRLREEIRREMDLKEGFEFFVAGVNGLERGTRRARLNYMRSILDWHRSWPLKGYIIYGSNRILRTAANLARTQMPFPVRLADGLEEALEMVAEIRREQSEDPGPRPDRRPALVCHWNGQTSAHVDEILSFLADIDWEGENPGLQNRKDPSHPFFEIFEAISLIKSELDELFLERARADEEKLKMEARLRRTEKMEAVGTLAGGIAHDFNNILAAIVGYAELAKGEIPNDNRARRHLEQILASSQRAKDLIQQILSFSRRSDQDLKPILISPLIREVAGQVQPSLLPQIKIKLELPLEEGTVLANPSQIHQVLMNLIDNGIRAMESEGGVLEVGLGRVESDADGPAGETELEPGPYLVLWVRDSGIGIEARIMDRIFEPFFTTREVGQGRGMGLAVVHGIVKGHGGALNVSSRPGQGSTFRVFLPLLEEG